MTSHFPANPANKRVLATICGGLGDGLMIANTCAPLCDFTLCVHDHHRPLIERIKGCKTESLNYFKDILNYSKYDACVNFMYFLSTGMALKEGGYYNILEKKICHKSPLAGFDFSAKPEKGIFLHLQASNPNRDWMRAGWEALIPKLQELDTVYVLGRKSEYRPEIPGVVFLADENEDLVWQSERLATAKYYIGVDSGFCHVSGILGVPGSVLFMNTSASDVIHRYPSLTGIDAFGGNPPSRSLRPGCATSKRYQELIQPSTVFETVSKHYG